MRLIDEAYNYALIALEHCAKPVGFYASGLPGGYEAVWGRDSMITSLGASLVRLPMSKILQPPFPDIGSRNIGLLFKKAVRNSLQTLGKNQAWHGAIPNAVGSWNEERQSDVTFNSIDSSLWYIIGNYVYAKAYKDKSVLKKHKKNIERAMRWIAYQDPNNDGIPVQQPTMDWEDIFPHKYGRTINTQALYYAALNFLGENKKANRLKRTINGEERKTLSLYDKKRGYYLPWIWKYHGPMGREEGHWFDTLGNLLAIVSGLATPKIAKSILNYIEKNKINRPFPCKSIWPALKKGDPEWHWYFETAESKDPYCYSNAGIWPFIGGFYVAALVKAKEYKKAAKELEMLALANKQVHPKEKQVKDFGFQEWLHGETGKAMGGSSAYQAWSAGMYVYAYECVKSKKVLFFD
ncbi:MAG: hypothetical protein HYT12_00630 [Candidatus Liptonbacteria bacterium]|nr:hypothetical protein [Candidatus Liptonbacteria bacterium]